MNRTDLLLNGNEAVAMAARDANISLGVGYPGTPSTEILENFDRFGGAAEWAPNEKVALEVGLGVAYGNARALVTMKHVGLNVASDPLFTAAYTGAPGALTIIVADDPGMASSQNEQDSRRYAVAAGVPMLEPCDAQDAYDMLFTAVEIAERWEIPVLLRMTTRICHSKSIIRRRSAPLPGPSIEYRRNVPGRVMIPGYARSAHRRLRDKLAAIAVWAEEPHNGVRIYEGGAELGILADGVSVAHAREAAPDASVLQIRMIHPFPAGAVRAFAERVERCLVIEEGDPVIHEQCRIAGIHAEGRPEAYRFGELDVNRARRILAGDTTPETVAPKGKPPQLCPGCPHRIVFETLRDRQSVVCGDIGCYTLGALPPFDGMDTTVCMGASIGVGLGLRHVLPDAEARRVVSVIGDSTFMHSGLTGIAEMVYNPPPTGHVVLVLDNETTAMTGMQEHPGTGRKLGRQPATRIAIETVCQAMGVTNVHVIDHVLDRAAFVSLLQRAETEGGLWVIVTRRPCLLSVAKQRKDNAADGSPK